MLWFLALGATVGMVFSVIIAALSENFLISPEWFAMRSTVILVLLGFAIYNRVNDIYKLLEAEAEQE